MSQILQVLLLLVLILPLSPKAPVRADSNTAWRGTVVHSYAHSTIQAIAPPTGTLPPTRYEQSVAFRMTLDVEGDQTTVSYSETYVEYQWFKVNQPEQCVGQMTLVFTYNQVVAAPVDVYLDNRIVNLTGPYITFTPSKQSYFDPCWAAHGYDPGRSHYPLSEHLRPWEHGGAFSPADLVVIGRDRWLERNWDYPPGGPQSQQIVFTSYNLTREDLDTPWLSQEWKDALNEASWELGKFSFAGGMTAFYLAKTGRLHLALVPEILSLSAGAASLLDGWLAKDPPDPNFTEIAIPVTPTTSQQPILPNDDLSQTQADTLNAVIENLQQGIGLAQAMLTSFNRASGAQVASNSYWVNRQLQVARLYSGQLADVLDAQLPLLADLQQALLTAPALSFAVTAQDLLSFKSNLVINGLSAEQSQLLTELGMDARGREEILNALLETEIAPGALPGDTIAIFPDFFTDEELIASTQNVAAALREFSQSGATRELYLPLILR